MNNLQVFKSEEFGEVRSLLINNKPWFIGKQVADILGYQNGSRDIKRHVDEEDRQVIQNYQNGTLEIPNRGLMIINESGLYSLILSSKLPTAKRCKINERNFSNMLCNRQLIRPEHIPMIASALDVSIDDLFKTDSKKWEGGH